MGLTASVYVRLSRQRDATNLSLAGMLADCHALAAREGLTVVGEHVDDGISGAVRDRPEFLAWLDDAERVDVLITWHVDRLSREGLNVAARIMDVVEGKHPTTGKVVNRPVRLLDTRGLDSKGSDAWRMQFVVTAEVARAERQRQSDRNTARAARAKAAGRYAGGRIAYGYRAVDAEGGGRVLVADDAEVATLREIARRVTAGESPARAARWANVHGAPTHSQLAATKRREAAIAQGLPFDPTDLGQPWGQKAVVQVLTGNGSVLLTASERAAVAEALAARRASPRGPRERRATRLLSGFLRCSGCADPLHVASGAYRCKSKTTGTDCPAPVWIRWGLETEVEALWLDGWGRLAEYEMRTEANEVAEQRAAAYEAVTAARAALATADDLDAAVVVVKAAQAEADRLDAMHVPIFQTAKPTGRTNAEAWQAGSIEDRRDLLHATVGGPLTVKPSQGRNGPAIDRIDVERFTP